MQAMGKLAAHSFLIALGVWALVAWSADAFVDVATEAEFIDAITTGQNVTITASLMLSQEISIASSITIKGNCLGGCPLLIIGEHRHFNINGSAVLFDLHNVTLDGGSADYGGSVLVTGGATAIFSFVEFKNNRATAELGAGGALRLVTGIAFVRVCVMTNNTAAFGGAIEAAEGSQVTVRLSTLKNNSASVAGGAINAVSGGAVVLRNSVLDGNDAPIGGAANSVSATINACASNTTNNIARLGLGPNILAGVNASVTFCQNRTSQIVHDRNGKVQEYCAVCLPPSGLGMHPPGRGRRGMKGMHPYNVGMHSPRKFRRRQ